MHDEKHAFFLPLKVLYEHAGDPLPHVEFIYGAAMPEPFRELLVHHRDMTSTLADFHQCDITLEVVRSHRVGEELRRLVVLHNAENQQPVEFGGIQIHLDRLPAPTVDLIAEGNLPLGAILDKTGVEFRSAPSAYLKVFPDPITEEHLMMPSGETTYGRCNALTTAAGTVFAEIVEILPLQNRKQ